MARKYLTALDMTQNELQNAQIQNLAGAPSAPVKGQIYMNSSDNTLYWHDGTAWVSARGGGTGFPGFGAVTAQTAFGAASNNGVGTTTSRTDHVHGTPTHDAAAHSTIPVNSLLPATNSLDMNSNKIINVNSPTNGNDAANKSYVDMVSQGLSWKSVVRAATTGNIALTGIQTIDGVANIGNLADRVLVKNQTAPAENGIYEASTGAWNRTLDASPGLELVNACVWVSEGTTLADTAWVCTTNPPISLGTTGITWVQFGQGTAYIAGAGLLLTGSTFDVVTGSGISVAGDQVSVNFAGTGSAVTAAKSDHTHADVPTTRQVISGAGLTGGGDLSTDRTLNVAAADSSITVNTDNIQVAHAPKWSTPRSVTLTGDVTGTVASVDGSANVSMATTLAVSAMKEYRGDIPAGTAVVVTHNMNTRDIIVDVYRNTSPWDTVECDVERTSVNTATVRFAVAVSAGQYRFVAVGK